MLYVIDKNSGARRKAGRVKCSACGSSFLRRKTHIKEINFCGQKCWHKSLEEKRKAHYIDCDFCNESFYRKPGTVKKTFNFCNRKCKEEAQRNGSGKKFDNLRPNHYGTEEITEFTYRKYAIKTYGSKCEICGYDEVKCVLEVHHIDEDRKNNSLKNLIVLCANHHAMITRNYAKLKNRKLVVIEKDK